MTRPEPAGAGTAEMIAREFLAMTSRDTDPDIIRLHFQRLVDKAITAAESRAMERCAKIAERYALANLKAPDPDDDWEEATAASGVAQCIANEIRSSISPQGTEE